MGLEGREGDYLEELVEERLQGQVLKLSTFEVAGRDGYVGK